MTTESREKLMAIWLIGMTYVLWTKHREFDDLSLLGQFCHSAFEVLAYGIMHPYYVVIGQLKHARGKADAQILSGQVAIDYLVSNWSHTAGALSVCQGFEQYVNDADVDIGEVKIHDFDDPCPRHRLADAAWLLTQYAMRDPSGVARHGQDIIHRLKR